MKTPRLHPQPEDRKEVKEELTDRLPYARRKFELLGWGWRFRQMRTKGKELPDSRLTTNRFTFRWKTLHPRNISVIYLYLVTFALFSLWVPETWLSTLTHKTILNQEAVRIIVSLGLIAPLAAGVFDLSIGGVISLSSMLVSWLILKGGFSIWSACLIALGTGVLVGALNAFLILKIKIDSFITTLGMSSILYALASAISSGKMLFGFDKAFKNIARFNIEGVEANIFYALLFGAVLWWFLESTPGGRYLFATGGNREAARLAGVSTNFYITASLILSSTVAALGGILITSKISSGSPTVGPPFLLPAFAAVFFGSTQFIGRFNVAGTFLAVLVLSSGVKGLQLAGVTALWVDDLFFGLALILAVGFSTYRRKVYGGERRWWRREENETGTILGLRLPFGLKRPHSKKNLKEWWYDPDDQQGHHIKPE
jgi:ribose transport system permease protein